MRRRNFIRGLAATAAWPVAGRAQQPERVRRIGVLQPGARDDPENRLRLTTFQQALQGLGWTDGRNVHIETRFSAAGDAADARKNAAELAALAPDVILSVGSSGLPAVLQTTRTVPIVFVLVPDPVGSGFVHSLSQPGGNATGFMTYEYNLCGKWPELLKEIAPGVTRAAVLRDPAITTGIGQFAVIQSVAPSVGVEVIPINLSEDPAELEREVAAFAQTANGGLIMTAGVLSATHRDLIVTLAAQHKLPAVYQERNYVAAGGLISYGPNFVEQFRRAAGYVDRIIKGEKPADLPVQAPTKYELVINLKTAKALGLAVPPSVRARRREFITLVGGASATWPLAARAQHSAPLIGFLSSRSPEDSKPHLAGFLRGLEAFGYVDGKTATIEYRWARGQYDQLPKLASELANLHPTIIAAPGGMPSARAAKLATTAIPIFFVTSDSVQEGLVASLNKPGGNITGVDIMSGELTGKRLELIARLVSSSRPVAFLANTSGQRSSSRAKDFEGAARSLSRSFIVVDASDDAELESIFSKLAENKVGGVVVENDPFFDSRREQIIRLTAQRSIPAIYHIREFPAAGGLMSYGASLVDAYYQMGIQAGRFLKGANIADLPVVRPTKFELTLNLTTAKALGLNIPPSILAIADEVIE